MTTMFDYLMESVVIAFAVGAVVGAIVALHLAHGPVKVDASQDEYDRADIR